MEEDEYKNIGTRNSSSRPKRNRKSKREELEK
jgi:hypothetical protein